MARSWLLVLWDIDHTLIENAGVSKKNYGTAFEILTGRASRFTAHTSGRTDAVIMEDLLKANGEDPESHPLHLRVKALSEAGARNRQELADRGCTLPGVEDCLSRLWRAEHVKQSVLTGNIKANAKIKLSVFDLDRWMDLSVGAFGDEEPVRSSLVPVAWDKARARFGFDPQRDATVVIGDTRNDVQAARRGGARVLGVATGTASGKELAEAGADAVLPGLNDAERFWQTVQDLRALH
ncbi:MAG: hypothetical protein QG608_1533 [Actinomycetota bacterium]|nr:hypothetical protein [Actinomycetota bacterium]